VPTTLLAVDDSLTMRKVLELTFAGEADFRVVTADGIESGLAKLRAERPGLVLADASLEGQGGYGLCSRIKAESPGTFVIVLSSKQQPYDQAKGTAARADDFIDKPFDTQQLIDKVKKLVSKPAAEPIRQTGAYPVPPSPATPPVAPRAPAGAPPMPAAASPGSIARPPIGARPTAPGMGNTPGQVGRGTLAYGGGIPGSTPQAPVGAGAPQFRPAAPSPPTATPASVAPHTTPGIPPAAARPMAPAPAPAPAAVAPAPPRAPAVHAAPAVAAAVGQNGPLATKLAGLGLTEAQVAAVLSLSRDVIEKVVWEVVPVLAETMIREELKRLTSD
jgi:CheY-like chemotaxis protein